MQFTIYSVVVLCFLSTTAIALSAPQKARSAETCADPTTAVTFVQGFNIGQAAYALAPVAGYTAGITGSPTSGWVYQGEVFLGWDTQETSTVGLYRLFNPSTTDYISVVSTDGGPPSVSGFTVQGLLGFVYSTQVCGSIPLLGAFNAAAGSHYYTTKANDHAQLITSSGWVDAGVVAYVLPLSVAW